ncbi:MAG TPA: Rho termination factor N-terminal domain-containing protein [Acidimicrobiales bacterium]|nr:Rho termination factor N-terminal domain-containing protein [Acidimicrobiales bacterium]
MPTERIPFDFEPRYRLAGRLFGVTPSSAYVELDDERLVARFGPWRVETPRSNIRGAGVTGPYSVVKTIGAAHLSVADRGLTFATNSQAGACLTFREPVTGIDPMGLVKHPGLTVTVANPSALVADLTDAAPVLRTDLDAREAEQQAVDDLHTMTAKELRALADDLGVRHTSSMNKQDLVDLIEPAAGDDLVDLLGDRGAK